MLWQMGECLCVSVCTLVYCTQLLSTPSSSSPTSDDVYPVRAALHAGRRLSAHVLSGRQRQVQSLAAAQGAGSGVVTRAHTKAVPSVPVKCCLHNNSLVASPHLVQWRMPDTCVPQCIVIASMALIITAP